MDLAYQFYQSLELSTFVGDFIFIVALGTILAQIKVEDFTGRYMDSELVKSM